MLTGRQADVLGRNEHEIEVAPIGLRLGAVLGAVAPTVSGTVQRWAGAGRTADAIARGQRGTS